MEEMGFDGLVLTDDLDMGAIVNHYDIQSVIHRIFAAEIDLVLICHKGPNIEIAYEELLLGIKGSADMRIKGIESVKRIMKLKNRYL